MDWTQALLLGVIQGLTEFLPVSSSGHLVLGQRMLGLTEPHLLFDVAVHVGTLLAVVAVFAEDLQLMIASLVPGRGRDGRGRRLLTLVAVGMVPAAIAGLLFRDTFEALYASTLAVGVALLLTGSMLMLTFLIPNGARNLERGGVPTAFVVGVAQAIAIIPGISRSGATISVGLALGLGRGSAARLSFLLSIPAILGALVLQLAEVGELAMREVAPLLVGGASAAITGYFALRLLVRVVQGGKIYLFAFYCWTVGAASIAASLEIW
jgi:undecaprenyl-diphosphatase